MSNYSAPDDNPFGNASDLSSVPSIPSLSVDPNQGRDPTLDAIMDGIDGDDAVASIPTAGLEFQDSKFSSGDASGTMMAPQTSSMHSSGGQRPASPGAGDTDALMANQQDTTDAPIWSVQYYQKFFDVDTEDVASRLTKAMMPFNTKFIEEVAPNPDLYGPFWVATTLVFSMAASGNFANYLSSGGGDDVVWAYDFNKVTLAAAVIYGYAILLPLAINCTAMYFTDAVGFIQLVCVYGYSLTVFIVASFLCIIPSELLRWIFVLGAFAVSGGVIWGNIGGRLENLIPGKGQAVTLALVAIHAALALTFKVYFFEYL